MRSKCTILVLIGVLLTTPFACGPVARAGAAAQTVRIGFSTWVGYGPLFLAREKRFFDDSVNVKFENIQDPKPRFLALAQRELDGLVTTLDTMSLYWNPAFPSPVVLALGDSRGNDGIVATTTIASIKDLRGKRVAVNRVSTLDFFLNVLLRDNGMTEDDLDIVTMRQDAAGKAFLDGQVDAAVTWEPWLSRVAARAPGAHVLIDTSETPGLLVDVLLFRHDVIAAHPEAIKAIVAGWYRAVDYWKQNPDDANGQMAKAVGGWLRDVRIFKETLKGVRYYDRAINKAYMTPGGQVYVTVQKAIDIWTSLRWIKEKMDANDLIDAKFVMGI